jgi:hypothetical protein
LYEAILYFESGLSQEKRKQIEQAKDSVREMPLEKIIGKDMEMRLPLMINKEAEEFELWQRAK